MPAIVKPLICIQCFYITDNTGCQFPTDKNKQRIFELSEINIEVTGVRRESPMDDAKAWDFTICISDGKQWHKKEK